VARGHAIEVRLCAEDPAQGFLPQAGRLLACRFPHAPGLRVDAGVERGDAIPVQYDSLVAKIVAHAATRDAAIARLAAALRRTVVFGVRTNTTLLTRILAHPRFVAGDIDTAFVADELESLLAPPTVSAAAAAAAWLRTVAPDGPPDAAPDGPFGTRQNVADSAIAMNPWTTLRGWRG
jgi:acetyl/propionyl-CoA carboxylase alpha subunit